MSTPELESATPASRKPTTVYLRAKGGITIPQPIRDELGLEIEDQLIVTVENGRIILTPAAVVPRTSSAWVMEPKPSSEQTPTMTQADIDRQKSYYAQTTEYTRLASEQNPSLTGTHADAELEDTERDTQQHQQIARYASAHEDQEA
jgi:AbrB family looped-hinge helix DNA binding protein